MRFYVRSCHPLPSSGSPYKLLTASGSPGAALWGLLPGPAPSNYLLSRDLRAWPFPAVAAAVGASASARSLRGWSPRQFPRDQTLRRGVAESNRPVERSRASPPQLPLQRQREQQQQEHEHAPGSHPPWAAATVAGSQIPPRAGSDRLAAAASELALPKHQQIWTIFKFLYQRSPWK